MGLNVAQVVQLMGWRCESGSLGRLSADSGGVAADRTPRAAEVRSLISERGA